MAAFPARTPEDEQRAEEWWKSVRHLEGGAIAAKAWYATALAYEREIATLRVLLGLKREADADETEADHG